MKKCSDCKFWVKDSESTEWGDCCRYPPYPQSMSNAKHPKVHSTDGCGEFATVHKKKKKESEAPLLPLIAELWNQWAAEGLARVLSMSSVSSRFKNAELRWREQPSQEYWISVIQRVNKTPFLLGDNDRKWRADIEFLVRTDNHARILEGKYDKETKSVSKQGTVVGRLEDGTPVIK